MYCKLLFKKNAKLSLKSEQAYELGEIIRFTWWTSDVVHHSTKKLPLV